MKMQMMTKVMMTMMMICGHSGQVSQRNAIPTSVKLWLSVQSSSKTEAKTVIPSWVHLDPVQRLSNADKAYEALAHCHIPIAYCAILAVRLAVS